MADLPPEVVQLVHDATQQCVLALFRDRALVDALVEPRIRQRVMAGDFVPRERLQVGNSAELAPIGLEQAARALIQAAAGVELPELTGFSDALRALTDLLEPPTSEAPRADQEEATEIEPEPVEEAHTCKVCGTSITLEQALASRTRHRVELCAEHHASHGPKDRKAS